MGLLKSSNKKGKIQSLSVNLWNELQDMDENYAESYLNWCIEKVKVNKLHQQEQLCKKKLKISTLKEKDKVELQRILNTVKYKNHPKNISKGDIIHVRFGVNLGDELSDLDSTFKKIDGHYGIVISQKGFMFLVIPLTSHPQRSGDADLDFCLENLQLPGGHNKSYLAFAKMKFIHIRRIKRIHGIHDGKKILTPEQLEKVDKGLKKLIHL